jgi:hypothetical protein
MNMYVGMTCLYHYAANETKEPSVAFVTHVHGSGRVDLAIVPHSGGEFVRKKNVRHIDDPIFTTRPQLALREGAWENVHNAVHSEV